jgi:hypothetical protein
MTRVHLPDLFDLQMAHELGALAVLDVSLVVADQSLRLQHAPAAREDIDSALHFVDPDRPAHVVLAAVLTDRFREVRALLGAYNDAVRSAALVRDNSDIPF